MALEYKQQELYGRALFHFERKGQIVNVAFEHFDGNEFMCIIFCDSGQIIDPHDEEFQETISDIVRDYQNDDDIEFQFFTF